MQILKKDLIYMCNLTDCRKSDNYRKNWVLIRDNTIYATNSALAGRYNMTVTDPEPCAFAVSKELVKFLRAIPGDSVHLTVKDDIVYFEGVFSADYAEYDETAIGKINKWCDSEPDSDYNFRTKLNTKYLARFGEMVKLTHSNFYVKVETDDPNFAGVIAEIRNAQ